MLSKANFTEQPAPSDAHRTLKIVGDVGDFRVKPAELKGPFFSHPHDLENETWPMVKGRRCNGRRERDAWLDDGKNSIAAKRVAHCPVAELERI